MPTLYTIAAIQRDGYRTDVLAMEFEVFEKENFDLTAAVRAAVKEYVSQTSEGFNTWANNSEYFNWADFWVSVPNEICEKHGFRKVTETIAEHDVDKDECLFEEEDFTLSNEMRSAIVTHLAESQKNREQFMEIMDLNGDDLTDPGVVRELLDFDLMPYELVQYYWEHVAHNEN